MLLDARVELLRLTSYRRINNYANHLHSDICLIDLLFISSRKVLMIDFKFISRFPDIKQTNRRMKAVEDGERHRDVCDNHPSPLPEKLQVRWPEASMSFD